MAGSILARAVVALGLFSGAHAAISRICPSSEEGATTPGVCYSLNIPDSTAQSGEGDIYFQITAPTEYEWVGLGQGHMMAGSNIFVMYLSADGMNVTVSARVGKGHIEPETEGATAQITVLEGSGVMDGTMMANVKCSNCNSWSGGTMDFTSTGASWIHAAKSGTPIMSDSIDEEISFHSAYGDFEWEFATATGGSDVNPFVMSEAESSNTTSASGSSSSSMPGSSSNSTANSGSSSTNTTTTTVPATAYHYPSNLFDILKAHGVMASLAWVIIIPTGAIIIRIAPFKNAIWVHVGLQWLGYAIFVAAFGMGVWMSTQFDSLDHKHPIIGIVVFVLASIQPISGNLHHIGFKKRPGRNTWSWLHLAGGRVAVILGMINGGLGLQWAANASKGQMVAYGVVAGIFGAAYIAAIIVGEMRRGSKTGTSDSPPPGTEKEVSRVSTNDPS